jgi:hypothetical protein
MYIPGLGFQVDRPAAAHAAATTPYFTIAGGRVLVTSLIGLITVASGANACSWQATPTAGTPAVLCANLDINPALVGDVLTITGLAGDAMIYGAAAGLGMGLKGRPLVLTTGTLDFIAAAADGTTSWTLFYIPVTAGATIVIA